jgi:penicillin amidase
MSVLVLVEQSDGLLMRIPLLIAKWLAFLLGGLLIGAVVLGSAWWSRLPRSVALLSGEIMAEGATAAIEIVRDRNDVPHIRGETEGDVYFGLGFVHAQDRLWQMAFYRRLMQGRLSELVGPLGLKPDQLARALDFAGRARLSLDHLSPRAHLVLGAYAAGVNAWAFAHRTNLPPEFQLLMTGFEPWRPEDSLLMLKFMAISLSSNAIQEVQHARLIKLLGGPRAGELFPPYPQAEPNALRDAAQPAQHAMNISPDAFFDRLAASEAASNNWVVDGRFTKSGKPLLANDPHLGLSAPGVWYLAHLALPSGDVVGGTIAGIPTIILGHNDHIAWGFTTTHADTEDLVIETLDPANPANYLTPHGPQPFTLREETIRVRFGKSRTIKCLETRNGPVLPPIFKSLDEIAPKGTVVALSAAALSRDDTTFDAGVLMIDAKSPADFERALEVYQAPMQNMVWATTDGHIGFIAPARLPVRGTGAVADGLTPADGKSLETLWTGYVPFALLPHTVDPPSGKVWTANNKIVPDTYPYLVAGEWPAPYRAHRIRELLAGAGPFEPKDFVRMQMDIKASEAALLLPRLLTAPPAGAREVQASKLLFAWDQEMRADRAEPLIYVAWLQHLNKLILADDFGVMARELRGPNEAFLALALGPSGDADWCDDQHTKDIETCDQMIARALTAALDDIGAGQGEDIAKWQWGKAHIAHHVHALFGAVPLLSRLFNRDLPVSGGANTLNRADMSYSGRRPYAASMGAGYRAVYDLADLGASRFMIAVGQSGNPMSPFYDTFLKPAAAGATILVPTDPKLYAVGALGTWIVHPTQKLR